MSDLIRTAAAAAVLGAATAAVLLVPTSGSLKPSTSGTALSEVERQAAATAYSAHEIEEQQRRLDALVQRLDPRLRSDAVYVVKPLSVQATAGAYWDVEPGASYRVEVSPAVEHLEDDALLHVLTHEASHVRQFDTYDLSDSWLGRRHLDRMTSDLALVRGSSDERGIHPVEVSADCMTALVLGDDHLEHSAYVDTCDQDDRAAAQQILDGEALSAAGWLG